MQGYVVDSTTCEYGGKVYRLRFPQPPTRAQLRMALERLEDGPLPFGYGILGASADGRITAKVYND